MATTSNDLFLAARRARENAYSPYSGHKVGAAIRLSSGQIFEGCNVENASFGGTICAERVAVTRAIADLGTIEVIEVLVLTDATPPWPPCGLCRQVIAEFAKDCTVHCANLQGELISLTFEEIFPRGFNSSYLNVTGNDQ